MKPRTQLVKEGIINESKEVSRAHIAKFYKEQLIKFAKLGTGSLTENNVLITDTLINVTKKRLNQLMPLSYEEGEKNDTM